MGISFGNHLDLAPGSGQWIARHTGRYLVATYWLWAQHDRRIQTGELSDRLSVKPASVTEMFGKLDEASLVEYEKQSGVLLTKHGRELAQALAWRQCLVRMFFAERVDTELSAADAYRIGFTLSEGGIDRLRELVNHPCESACQKTGLAFEYCLLHS